MNKISIPICLVLLLIPIFASAQEFKLDKDRITVAVNSPKTKEASIVATAIDANGFAEGATIDWSGHGDSLDVSQSLSSDRKMITTTFTAKKAAQSLTLKASVNNGPVQTLIATVQPEVSAATLTLSVTDAEKTAGIQVTIGGARLYRFALANGALIPANAISVKSDNDSFATATLQGDVMTIRGTGVGETNVRIFAYGNSDPIGNLQVKSVAGIETSSIPSKISVNRNEAGPVELKDSIKVDLAKLDISAPVNQDIAQINAQNQLIGLKPGETTFRVTVKDVPDRIKDVTVEVLPKAEKIVSSIPLNNKSLIRGIPNSFTLGVEGDGVPISKATIDLTTSDAECVSVSKTGGNNFTIRSEQERCNPITLTATAKANGKELRQDFTIVPFSVVDFAPLRIRLDVMDDQTAQDLFGKKANDEYIIAKVRLFNAIGRGDANFGKSILVYSESLEVKVGVEWREVGGSGDHAQWRTLDEKTAESWFNGAQLTAASTNRNCTTISQPHLFIPYRPLTFDIVSNTHERRDNRSWRSKFFLALNGFSTLASVVTSVAVPSPGNDIPLGLDKFRNLLIPGIEKLFPSMKEVQRQNITSMVMKPLEEVPFGSDITRILFFPRRTIRGVLINLPNGSSKSTELRISAVSISDSCAEVGIIDKVNSSPTP